MQPTILADLHVHTRLSHDGSGTVKECCEVALRKGLGVVGFAEHVDFDPLDPGVGYFDYARVAAEVEEARRRYAGRLRVLLGVEIDYQDWFEDHIAAFLAAHTFDYTIGSVHAIAQQRVMGAEYVAERSMDTAYTDYFRAAARCAASGLFDVLGHLEYAMRGGLAVYGAYDPERYGPEIDEVLDATVAAGAVLEVNGAGLRHGVGQTYPSRHVVRRFMERGGSAVCVGSDAHQPSDVGCGIRDLGGEILESGFGSLWFPSVA